MAFVRSIIMQNCYSCQTNFIHQGIVIVVMAMTGNFDDVAIGNSFGSKEHHYQL